MIPAAGGKEKRSIGKVNTMDDSTMTPKAVRALIRQGKLTGQTSGMCAGYAQANLLVLPRAQAYDFLLFTQRNPKSCPILEVGDVGSRLVKRMADGADIATDIPKYRVWENGVLTGEFTEISHLWQNDFVYFLIGCSFSFEGELLAAGVPVRHIEEGKNVPMYLSGILMYINPTLQMLVGLVLYGEDMDLPHIIMFACVWIALILFIIFSRRTEQVKTAGDCVRKP